MSETTTTKKPLVEWPLRVFLDLSTAHLTPATRELLKQEADNRRTGFAGEDLPVSVASTQYGWFVYVPDEVEGLPEDLARCVVKAQTMGADYLLFDCDGYFLEGLPIYEGVSE